MLFLIKTALLAVTVIIFFCLLIAASRNKNNHYNEYSMICLGIMEFIIGIDSTNAIMKGLLLGIGIYLILYNGIKIVRNRKGNKNENA